MWALLELSTEALFVVTTGLLELEQPAVDRRITQAMKEAPRRPASVVSRRSRPRPLREGCSVVLTVLASIVWIG
jgi:hypothetical protein